MMELRRGMFICITFRYAAFSLLFDHMKRIMCGHCPVFVSHVFTPPLCMYCTAHFCVLGDLHMSCFVELTSTAGG